MSTHTPSSRNLALSLALPLAPSPSLCGTEAGHGGVPAMQQGWQRPRERRGTLREWAAESTSEMNVVAERSWKGT